jgi:hypothetical protein
MHAFVAVAGAVFLALLCFVFAGRQRYRRRAQLLAARRAPPRPFRAGARKH